MRVVVIVARLAYAGLVGAYGVVPDAKGEFLLKRLSKGFEGGPAACGGE